ncbi:uncharacterized protein LOC143178970 [Calliopsis andreniformis]|uniref:uncharacterized protein LOC143178970 n=1 Tax=Calliopsis andreniformis TaxID=337506 RepID=UPI003FCC4CB4
MLATEFLILCLKKDSAILFTQVKIRYESIFINISSLNQIIVRRGNRLHSSVIACVTLEIHNIKGKYVRKFLFYQTKDNHSKCKQTNSRHKFYKTTTANMKYFAAFLSVLCICLLGSAWATEEIEEAKFNPLCSVCKLAMKEVDQRLVGDKTRGKVENAVHSVCNHLPHAVSGKCNEFINKHGAQIIDVIVDKGVPMAACAVIRVC